MENTVNNEKRIEAEGFFRNKKGSKVPTSMKNALEKLIHGPKG